MHEIVIANKIIEDLKEQVGIGEDGSYNYDKIKSVKFEVGDLAHLSAEELEQTLKGMVKFDIIVEKKKAIVRCGCGHNNNNNNNNSEYGNEYIDSNRKGCGYIGEPKILERGHHNLIYVCPKCERIPEIVEGGDIKIVEVEIIYED
ncbi:MAG: hydrogenase/urease maturation nickel metallochaperone HypA [Candidatus Woesearchaeota archaeon]